nr:AAA family ATPase [Pseudobdellovibrionaceae bacterium]
HEPDRSQTVIDQVLLNKDDYSIPITQDDINEAIKDLAKRDPKEWSLMGIRQKLKEFPNKYRKIIAGDTDLLDLFSKVTSHFMLGLVNTEGPAMKILLAGSHGVGKSSRGEAYAKAMGYESLIIEMNRYRPGSGLYSEQFMSEIAQQLLKDPHSVIILDEIEKCSPEVQSSLLRMLESDYFSAKIRINNGNYRSRKISVKFAKFIATTNAGHEYIDRMMKHETTSIGFVDHHETPNSQKYSLENAFSKINRSEFRAVLKQQIEPAIVDRFSGWHGVYIIPIPSAKTLKKILILNLSSQLKHLKKSLSYNVDIQLRGMGHLLDKYVQQIEMGRVNVRDSIKDILFEVREAIAQEIINSPEIGETDFSNQSNPKSIIRKSFAPPKCNPLFK